MTRDTKASLNQANTFDFTGAAVRHIIHPLWGKFRHPAFAGYLREFERNQYLQADDLNKLQMRRLRQQLIYAYCYVPLYRHRMTEAGLTPLDIRTHEDLRLIPVLTKRDLQDHQDLLVSSKVPPEKRRQDQTAGSSGSPLQFFVDVERFDSRMASTVRHNAWGGLRVGDGCAQPSVSRFDIGDNSEPSPVSQQKFLYRILSSGSAADSEQAMTRFIEVLRRNRPKYMVSNVQSAVLLAEFCRARSIYDTAFKSMLISADVLLSAQREMLEETFHGKVFERYCLREVGIVAGECEYHSGLHINADSLIVEVEPAPNLPAGMGRVLVTDLLNHSMPLIRYETGNVAAIELDTHCPCGRSLPLMGKIKGRTSDFVCIPSGRVGVGPSPVLLTANMRDVRQVQSVQPNPPHSPLRVVAANDYSQRTEREIRQHMQPYLEQETSLTIVTAESIPSEPSGNHSFAKASEDTDTPAALSR